MLSWRELSERYALPPVAAASQWLLLLSPLLSAAPLPHGLTAADYSPQGGIKG